MGEKHTINHSIHFHHWTELQEGGGWAGGERKMVWRRVEAEITER